MRSYRGFPDVVKGLAYLLMSSLFVGVAYLLMSSIRWNMDRISTLQSRIKKSIAQTKADQEALAKLKKKDLAKNQTQARKRDTRLKIIIGAIVVKRLQDINATTRDASDNAFRAQVFRLATEVLTLQDRDLLATLFPELAKRSTTATSSSTVPASTSTPAQRGS